MLTIFRERPSRRFLLGQTLSLFGDTSLFLALGIWTKTLTGSNSLSGAVMVAFVAPQLAGPFASVVVDYLPRRQLLIGLNMAAALVVLALLFVETRNQLWIIFCVTGVYGGLYPLLSACQVALLQEVVKPLDLGTANSYLRTVQEGSRLLGPLLGAGLFGAVGGKGVAIFDAASFVVAAGSLIGLGDDRSVASESKRESIRIHWPDVVAGFSFIWRSKGVRVMVLTVCLIMVTAGFTESALFAVVDDGLGRPPTFLGFVAAAQGAGSIGAGVACGWALGRFGQRAVVLSGIGCLGVGCLMMCFGSIYSVLSGSAFCGIGAVWLVISFATYLQTTTPGSLMGRVSGAAEGSISILQVFSIALGAILIQAVDYRILLLSVSIAAVLAAVFFALGGSDAGVGDEVVSRDPNPLLPD